MAVETVEDNTTPAKSTSKNTANPYWIDYIACLIAKETCTPIPDVLEMPYAKVLSYVHCVMRLNGNDTRWLIADDDQADEDFSLVEELLA